MDLACLKDSYSCNTWSLSATVQPVQPDGGAPICVEQHLSTSELLARLNPVVRSDGQPIPTWSLFSGEQTLVRFCNMHNILTVTAEA